MAKPEDNSKTERGGALLSWIEQFAPYGVLTLDTSLRVQSWNSWLESHSSLSSANVAGRSLFEIFPELEKRKLTSHFQRALEGESSVLSTSLHHYLLPLKSPSNEDASEPMRQTARIAPLVSEGKICGVVVVIEDVTQRENQAESLSLQHRRDEVLSWALVYLLKASEPRKTVRQLFFKIAEFLDFDTFFLYLREDESDAVKLYAAGGISDDLQKRFLEYELLSSVARVREPVILDSIKDHSEPGYALLKEAKISSAIVLPLHVNDKSLGSLCFATWNREHILPEEADLLTTIAQYLAAAVDKENTISERRRAEEKLAASYQREKLAREQAESANRAKDDFLASLSHELRTPLNPVLLIASDSSENPDFSPEVKAHFETIRKHIELEARLIDDLLDLTRITHGKLSLHPQVVDVRMILEETMATVQSELNEKRIRLMAEWSSPQIHVVGDAVRLQQVFWNVLKNAVKFTPVGGKISIATSEVNGLSQIKISDTGIGMTPEEIDRIFGAFTQGDHVKNDTHRFGGLGLGLAISRRLIEMHSGQITAQSPGLNLGSTFTIQLSTVKPPDDQPSPLDVAREDKESENPSGRNFSILLVEDHEPTRLALAHLLTRRQYKVVTAGNIEEAKTVAAKGKIDFVISDIGLPDGSGNILMRELRQQYGMKGIALTGYGMERDIEECLASGFVTHLIKPVSIRILENALEVMISNLGRQ